MSPRSCFVVLLWLIQRTQGWHLTGQPFYRGKAPFFASIKKLSSSSISQSTRIYASKFSQPAFSQPAFARNETSSSSSSSSQQQRRRKPHQTYGADSKIASLHAQRMKTAGRVGTKRYVDPCKVFFGNLPFHVTEETLQDWIAQRMGISAPLLLRQVNVIRDWKTSKSKGYGFAVFTEPIHATVCIEKCNGQALEGRPLSVNQGKKKESTQIFVKHKTRQPPVDADEAAIQAGLEEATAPSSLRMDPQEALMLRQLDPDLVDETFDDDSDLFDDDLDDDDGVDGYYFEDDDGDDDGDSMEDDTPMNRQKRRELARKKKKKKPANRGFGSST